MGMPVSVPRYTVDDLEQFPEDGNRYELLDGILLVTPQAAVLHQLVAGRLLVQLFTALQGDASAHVVGPGAVVRPPGTELQPDVLVFRGSLQAGLKWTDFTSHWLAVEILSPSSRIYDRDFKRAAYFALGVREVWLVDLDDRSVDAWTSVATHDIVRDTIRWRLPDSGRVVTVDVAALFAGMA